jgi:hypothetical protein
VIQTGELTKREKKRTKINISKMSKENIREALLSQISEEAKFLKMQSKQNPKDSYKDLQIFKPSMVGLQFLARNDIRPLKKVRDKTTENHFSPYGRVHVSICTQGPKSQCLGNFG